MATQSYFRERARNPYLRNIPGYEEEPQGVSPTFERPMPMAPTVVERPPMRAETPTPTAPPSPYERIERERAAYTAKIPTTTGGRFKEALLTAALGALQAAARDRENPLGAALGGAVTGGAISAINPRAGRAYQFETAQRPGIEERMRDEDEQRKRQQMAEDRARAISMDELKRRQIESGIAGDEAQIRARRFETVPYGAGVLDVRTGQITPGQPRAEASEYGSSPLGIYSRKTGQVTTPAAPKANKIPDRAFGDKQELDALKQAAMDMWTTAGQATPGSPERQEAEATARAALDEYNRAAINFGEMYGEWYEAGPGKGGWNYVKRRGAPAQGAAPGTGAQGQRRFPASELKRFAAERKWTEDQARQFIESRGYAVR